MAFLMEWMSGSCIKHSAKNARLPGSKGQWWLNLGFFWLLFSYLEAIGREGTIMLLQIIS